MTGWVERLAVAIIAQLAVLPGEKVRFIISGLSTRYRPAIVAAAGSAFAGWTAVELLVGEALQGALPTVVLNALTGGCSSCSPSCSTVRRRNPPRVEELSTDGGVLEAVLAILTGGSVWGGVVSTVTRTVLALL